MKGEQGGFPIAPLNYHFGRRFPKGDRKALWSACRPKPLRWKRKQGGFPVAPLNPFGVGPQAETPVMETEARGLSGHHLEPLRGLLFSRNVQRKKVAFMDRGGRYSRHYETPETRPPRAGLLPRIRGWMLRRGEGRKRITPGEPNTALGAGWQEAKHR